MKQRVSDYIADFLASHNITDVFTVTGGGAMYMNDSFGHHPSLHCTYNHHEQACAMAAEAYARIDNRIAAVCVTSGPGATNAITGVLCGWMDSIPMLIISGQVRYATTVYASGLKLRSRGFQEFDITGSVADMTKYCHLVKNPASIRFELEKALHLAHEGRPGPVWLDIPLDVQGTTIETDDLESFVLPHTTQQKGCEHSLDVTTFDVTSLDAISRKILERIKTAQRPVLFAGNGIRLAGAHEDFLALVEKLNIPVVTSVSSVDAIASNHHLYVGRSGNTGDRAGNFAVQNSDLFFSIGSRLSFAVTGFNYASWAREAYKIINDIDNQEIEKDSIKADLKVCADAKCLIQSLIQNLPEPLSRKENWLSRCQKWKAKYPVVLDKHRQDEQPNVYVFFDEFTKKLQNTDCLVVSVGSARIVGSQVSNIKEGMRFISNASTGSMGYCLPAAIGVCVANNYKKTYLVTGDGSIQMNIQELQTIVQNRLPIAIFVINNQGYHAIRMTQKNFFNGNFVGIGPDSHDLSFPSLEKIAFAYGIHFKRCDSAIDLEASIDWILNQESACICELVVSTQQGTEPKVASKRLADGSMVSAPLEDMAPFLSETELEENMYISKFVPPRESEESKSSNQAKQTKG